MTFTYIALNAKGEQTNGELEAQCETDAIQKLRLGGFYPTRIEKSKTKRSDIKETTAVDAILDSSTALNMISVKHLISVFFGALIVIFGGSYVCDVSDCDVTGIMMVIIGIILLIASAVILVIEHFNEQDTNRRY